MHFKSLMRAIGIIKTTFFKLTFLAISFVMVCYLVHSKESISSKAKRISFPGTTHVHFNRSAKNLTLEKLDVAADASLIQNLNQHKIMMKSALFIDKKNNLMVVIGEKSDDQQLVFILIKNNQVTQLQKINEMTNKTISLQYGKITLNTQIATAETAAAYDPL
ncbi:MAG: hypothetical protein H7235_11220 [Bdellovibrionaceae bacterium]|nr:hypothetical protein [Pseudobdellovibrionaceae bacterium]